MKSIGTIIQTFRKQKKISQTELAQLLQEYGFHLKKSAICSWEKNVSQPNATQLLALCKILGITNIYDTFIGGYHPDNPFSNLNDEGTRKAKEYIELLEKSGDYTREPDTVLSTFRKIRLFTLPVSAGTGEFLDSDDYEMVEVGNEVSQNADFGVRIHGDSMEPRYINGQIVWVEQMTDLRSGDIGIFYLDGDAYCKKLDTGKQGTFLVSLNPGYEPIPVTKESDFRIFGKVVC